MSHNGSSCRTISCICLRYCRPVSPYSGRRFAVGIFHWLTCSQATGPGPAPASPPPPQLLIEPSIGPQPIDHGIAQGGGDPNSTCEYRSSCCRRHPVRPVRPRSNLSPYSPEMFIDLRGDRHGTEVDIEAKLDQAGDHAQYEGRNHALQRRTAAVPDGQSLARPLWANSHAMTPRKHPIGSSRGTRSMLRSRIYQPRRSTIRTPSPSGPAARTCRVRAQDRPSMPRSGCRPSLWTSAAEARAAYNACTSRKETEKCDAVRTTTQLGARQSHKPRVMLSPKPASRSRAAARRVDA